MMGHRYKGRNGHENDCIGSPGHRWRDYMAKNAGRWKSVKQEISRRIRRENSGWHLNKEYESEQDE